MKVKKTIFWGAVITPMVLGVCFLFGGLNALAAGPHGGHGPGGMGSRGGFGGPHHVMVVPHNGGGFSWLFFLLSLLVGAIILVLIVKWVRKKAKAAAMQQFIDTSYMSSYRPIMKQNESILDQWEQNLVNKKENY
jgi:hypothetical protein